MNVKVIITLHLIIAVILINSHVLIDKVLIYYTRYLASCLSMEIAEAGSETEQTRGLPPQFALDDLGKATY